MSLRPIFLYAWMVYCYITEIARVVDTIAADDLPTQGAVMVLTLFYSDMLGPAL